MCIMDNLPENGSSSPKVVIILAVTAGAGLGSLIFPGIGTAIGAGIAAIIAGIIVIIGAIINNKK